MKNPTTQDTNSALPSAPLANRPAADARRLRVLLVILAFTMVTYGVTTSIIRSRKGKPVSAPIAPPKRTSILLSGAIDHAVNRRWLEAVEILDAASSSGETSVVTHRLLGRCLGELGWITDTISEYKRAIEEDPTSFDTCISLATAYRSVGRRTDALRTLGRAEALLRNGSYKEAPARYARPAAPMLEELAQAYAHVGEFPKSVEWATQAQTADPTRVQGYLLAAKSYFVLKQADRAIPLLQKACTFAPNDADAHYTLALALRARPSEPHNLAAGQHLLAAIKLDPNHAPALYQYGLLCMERKQWDPALTAFRVAHELQYEPGAVLLKAGQASSYKGDKMQAAFLRGQYFEYVGQLPAALGYFQMLVSDPIHGRAAGVFVARVLTKMGKYQAAIDVLKKAIALDPRSADLRRQLAGVYDKMHLVTRQIAALKEAAELDPGKAHRDYYDLGRIALDVGKYDEAEQLLEKSISLNPRVSQYHYSLGQTYLLRPDMGGRLGMAIQHLEEAERLAPDDVHVHDFLSTAYIKAGKWTEAAIALHRSANAAPQNEVLYFRLNQVYRRLGNEIEAKRAQSWYQRLRKQEVERDLLSRRVRANVRDPAAHIALGDLFLREQGYNSARREFEKALDLTPGDPAIHERLTTVYGELAQPEGQWQHLKEYRRLISVKKT